MATDEGFKSDLERALSSNTTKPAWCTFREIDDLGQFYIWIRGVGRISLSKALSQDNAKRIISTARSHHHPKLWTLDSSKFRISQSAPWTRWLDIIALAVGNDLGAAQCYAESSSLLLAEQGASLEPCKFIVDAPAGFATLMIGLPSEHSDGRLFFQRGKFGRSFPITTESSSYLAAWSSDAKHGFLPILTGFRWMLTFNLITHTPPPSPSIGLSQSLNDDLSRLLPIWTQNPSNHQYLCHVLSCVNEAGLPTNHAAHEYVERLRSECHSNRLAIFLATLERKIVGRLSILEADQPPQHRWIVSIHEEAYTITLHVTPQFQIGDLKLDTGNLLAPTCFDGLIPTEEQAEEQEGDQKPRGTQRYRLAAVVLIPYQNLRALISNFTAPNLMEYFINQALTEYLPDTELWLQIKTSCMEADIQSWPGHTMSLAIEASLRAQDYEVFEHLARNGQAKLCCNPFSAVEKAAIMKPSCISESLLQKGLSTFLGAMSHISARLSHIKAFARFCTHSHSSQAFLSTELMKLITLAQDYQSLGEFDTERSLGTSDGVALVDLGLDYLDTGFLQFRIMPIVRDPRTGPAVVLGFVKRLLERAVAHDIPHSIALELYRKLSRSRLLKISFEQLVSDQPQPSEHWDNCHLPRFSPATIWNQYYVDPRRSIPEDLISAIFRDLWRLNWTKLASSLADAMGKRIDFFRNLELHNIWVSLLGDMLQNITIDSPVLKEKAYQALFKKILRRYTARFVHRTGSRLVAWEKLHCGVDCSFCSLLNAIHSKIPTQTNWEITIDNDKGTWEHVIPRVMAESAWFDITWNATDGQQAIIRGKWFRNVGLIWESRQSQATSKLERMWEEDDKLKALIGKKCYTDLMGWVVQKPEDEAPGLYSWNDDSAIPAKVQADAAALVPSILARKRRLSEISRVLPGEQGHA